MSVSKTMKRLRFSLLIAAAAIPATARADAAATNAAVDYRQAIADLPADKDTLKSLDNWDDIPIDPTARALAAKFAPSLKSLHAATAVKQNDWGWDTTAGPETKLRELNGLRPLSQAAALQIRIDFADGKIDDAIATASDLIVLSRRVGAAPFVVSRLVAIGIEREAWMATSLTLPKMSKADAKKLADVIDAAGPAPDLSAAIKTDGEINAKWIEAGGKGAGVDDRVPEDPEARKALAKELRTLAEAAAKVAATPLSDIKPAADEYNAAYAAASLDAQRFAIKNPAVSAATQARYNASAAMFRLALDVIQYGPDVLAKSKDPSGNGPFEYKEIPGGFELSSKLVVKGKPVTMTFGVSPKN